MAAPKKSDWTRIYVAQRADAGGKFGDFIDAATGKPLLDASSKRVPKMPAEHARELLKYWVATAAEVRERTFEDLTSEARTRFGSAVAKFNAAMNPFAASVLIDAAATADAGRSKSVELSLTAVQRFWDAVHALVMALAAVGVSPSSSDLWWRAVDESVEDVQRVAKNVGKAVASGAGWLLVAGVVVAVVVLGKNNRG